MSLENNQREKGVQMDTEQISSGEEEAVTVKLSAYSQVNHQQSQMQTRGKALASNNFHTALQSM